LIRTVWLGIFFLIFLGGTAAFKFAFGEPEPAMAASALNLVASDHELPMVGADHHQDTLTKGDRLEIAYVHPATEPNLIPASHAPAPPRAAQTAVLRQIISRHWHDPNDPKLRQRRDQNSKRKEAKYGSAPTHPRATAESGACLSDGFGTIRRAFNLSPSCS